MKAPQLFINILNLEWTYFVQWRCPRFHLTIKLVCQRYYNSDFLNVLFKFSFAFLKKLFQFEDRGNETKNHGKFYIRSIEINPTGYTVETKLQGFGLRFEFSRDPIGFIVKYHLTCGVLVFLVGISFLIDPKRMDVWGRMGMLVTLFLVLANFFTNAQVCISFLFTKYMEKI